MDDTDKLKAAENAAQEIWDNLIDRRGVGDELENCDDDTQQEIKDTIASIISAALPRATPDDGDVDNVWTVAGFLRVLNEILAKDLRASDRLDEIEFLVRDIEVARAILERGER